jgi:hypothetical protein
MGIYQADFAFLQNNDEIPSSFFFVGLMTNFTINSCTRTSKSGKT